MILTMKLENDVAYAEITVEAANVVELAKLMPQALDGLNEGLNAWMMKQEPQGHA